MEKTAGKLCREDLILCAAVVIYFSHKRAGLLLSGTKDGRNHVDMIFDFMHRQVFVCDMLGQKYTSFGVVVSNEKYKTCCTKCNQTSVSNGSDISVLTKARSEKTMKHKFSTAQALYFIHRWHFPSVAGEPLNFNKLAQKENTAILIGDYSSNKALNMNKFEKECRSIFSDILEPRQLILLMGDS